MRKRLMLIAALFAGIPAWAADDIPPPTTAPAAPQAKLDPALEMLGQLVGGRWVCTIKLPNREMLVETRYEKAFNGQGIRMRGLLDKGQPEEIETEAVFGWDPVNDKVFYFDFHGHRDVFRGTVQMKEQVLESEFERIVGPPAKWRSRDELVDKDTLVFHLDVWKDGAWVKGHEGMTFKRVRD